MKEENFSRVEMKEDPNLDGEGPIFCCKKCGSNLQAGPRWEPFCPKCKLGCFHQDEPEPFPYPTQVMSCVHCSKPLVLKLTKDKRMVGRCYTENCGDCFSMQDLCLITFREEESKAVDFESLLENVSGKGAETLKRYKAWNKTSNKTKG